MAKAKFERFLKALLKIKKAFVINNTKKIVSENDYSSSSLPLPENLAMMASATLRGVSAYLTNSIE